MTTAVDSAFRERIERVEGLLQDMERTADPAARAMMQEIVQTLLDFHGTGLARILDHLAEFGDAGRAVLDRLARDELVASLLLLYDLHPLDLETRVRQALEGVRPLLRSHGGDVELLGVAEGVVRLRLQGSCNGCPSSAATLKQSVEDAVLAVAPEVTHVEAEGASPPPAGPVAAFVSIDELIGKNIRAAAEPARETAAR